MVIQTVVLYAAVVYMYTLFKTQERESDRSSKEIEQRKESQKKHSCSCIALIWPGQLSCLGSSVGRASAS